MTTLVFVALWICVCMMHPGRCDAGDNPLDYVRLETIQMERYESELWTNNPATRVDVDLSLDGGTNWRRNIAHGLALGAGTNEYTWSFRITPDLWTEHARIAVRSLWTATTNVIVKDEGDMSNADFAICGLRIISPTNGQTVLMPSYQPIVWHEAGWDSVIIGLSTNGGESYQLAMLAESSDPTNQTILPIINVPVGPLWIVVEAETNMYDAIWVNVEEQ